MSLKGQCSFLEVGMYEALVFRVLPAVDSTNRITPKASEHTVCFAYIYYIICGNYFSKSGLIINHYKNGFSCSGF